MAKILTILASPRKQGNTEILLQNFIAGATQQGHQIDTIILRNKKISPCLEIYGCKKDGRCVINDDFNEAYDKLEMCDKLVIATPIFFSALPAQLKALIDRCQAFYVRKYILKNPIIPPGAPKRDAYLLAVGGSAMQDLLAASLLTLKYFLKSLDMELKNTLVYHNVDEKGDIFKHPTALKEVYQLGLDI